MIAGDSPGTGPCASSLDSDADARGMDVFEEDSTTDALAVGEDRFQTDVETPTGEGNAMQASSETSDDPLSECSSVADHFDMSTPALAPVDEPLHGAQESGMAASSALVSGPMGMAPSGSTTAVEQAPAVDFVLLLPPQTGPERKTLVLDLDQTLIECLHLWFDAPVPADFIYTDCEGCMAKVWQRPHLMYFLEEASKHFEVVLFTAAAQRHADAVLAVVDPQRRLVHHRLYGHHTVATPAWGWAKDLSRLGRDLSKTLLVDDCVGAALLQPHNWLCIRPFSHTDVQWDTALLQVLQFLLDKVSCCASEVL